MEIKEEISARTKSFDLTQEIARGLNGLAGQTFIVDQDQPEQGPLKMQVTEVLTPTMMQSRLNQDGKHRAGNIKVTFETID